MKPIYLLCRVDIASDNSDDNYDKNHKEDKDHHSQGHHQGGGYVLNLMQVG